MKKITSFRVSMERENEKEEFMYKRESLLYKTNSERNIWPFLIDTLKTQHDTLTELCLYDIRMHTAEALVLFDIIRTNHTLQSLDISINKIGDED